jgi:hypothetical protein
VAHHRRIHDWLQAFVRSLSEELVRRDSEAVAPKSIDRPRLASSSLIFILQLHRRLNIITRVSSGDSELRSPASESRCVRDTATTAFNLLRFVGIIFSSPAFVCQWSINTPMIFSACLHSVNMSAIVVHP